MEHLIGEAKKYALQVRVAKPPSKHVDLLTLKVHRHNIAAQKLYNRYNFELLDGFEDKDHLMMFHKLDLEG